MLKDWDPFFLSIKNEDFSKRLRTFLDSEYRSTTIYPPRDMMFQAFRFTDPKTLKVVIVGQDPYHNPAQAMGMSFSVPRGIDPPPSLINIYKEIQNDTGIRMDFENGDLTPWAEQGVLLINAYLSVRAGKPLSHKCPEYEAFDIALMKYLDALPQTIVFMLWGSFAKRFGVYVTNPKHHILSAVHPSPMSANQGGWFNNHLFSKCNDFLIEDNVAPIDWKIG